MIKIKNCDRLERADTANGAQQLVARIKRSSKYYGQTKPGAWFAVCVVPDMGYGLRGNNNNYRFGDVVFGVCLDDGTIVDLQDRSVERNKIRQISVVKHNNV